MMKNFYAPLMLAIGGNALYHLSQKSIAKSINPLYALVVTYALAIVLCIVVAFFYPHEKTFVETMREANWAVLGVGVAAFLIEFGVLLAYRGGGGISYLGITVAVGTNLILLPIGLFGFREHLSKWNLLGIVFCILGLILVTKR
jgi:drug/metabolite transporter (DMT)-like permease